MQKYENKSENLGSNCQISGYQLLKLNLNQIEIMSKCGLSVGDVRYVAMYEEYLALLGKPLQPTDKDIITACYRMALKNLKDKDGIYDIRKYFGL